MLLQLKYCGAMQKVLIIVGPTASGKSALGVELARRFGGEVISADSRQVYRGLDIGTGKITKKEMRGIPHHLLDVASPKRALSADDFVKQGRKAIDDIAGRGKLPIVVGGTGFYIDALVGRMTLPDVPPDAKFRKGAQKKTVAQLYAQLTRLDPARAKAMHTPSERNNKVRIIRAIEIARALGKNPVPESKKHYDTLWICIAPSDKELKKKISKRLRDRLGSEMIQEAIRLHKKGLTFKRMRELGLEYRALARFLRGEISKAELVAELESDIWRYARKQIGYWKRNKDIRWFKPTDRRVTGAVTRWLKG